MSFPQKLTLHGWRNVYKLGTGHATRFFQNEVSAHSNAHQTWSVAKHGIFFSPLINRRTFFLARSRRAENINADDHLLHLVFHTLSSLGTTSATYLRWDETLPTEKLLHVTNHLDSTSREFLTDELGEVRLPVTGAHGDLAPKNILFPCDRLFLLIDWEFFRPTGSVYTDLLHLALALWRKEDSRAPEPPFIDAASFARSRWFKLVCDATALTPSQALLLSNLERCTMPAMLSHSASSAFCRNHDAIISYLRRTFHS